LLKASSDVTLKTSKEGASTISLGNLFQCITNFILFYVQSKSILFFYAVKEQGKLASSEFQTGVN